MRRLLALFAALTLVAAACSSDGDDAAPDDPTTTESTTSTSSTTVDGEPAWTTCENPEVAYRVAHPEAWAVNDGTVVPPCSLFDPEPFEVPEATEVPTTIALSFFAEPAPFATVVSDSPAFVESDRRDATVDGRTALRQELVATGEGLHNEGLSVVRWSIDLGGETLIAQTHDIPDTEPGFAEAQRVLDRMVESLTIDLVDDPAPTTTTTAPPDEGIEPVGTPGPDDVQSEGFPRADGPVRHLVAVRQATHDGFHRIVLEFEEGDSPPAYRVSYVDEPVRRPGSGQPVAVEGDARLELRLTPARTVSLRGDEPRVTYDGPERIAIDQGIVNELVFVGDFEATMSWVVGVDTPDPFAVAMYDDPTRLVVDIVSDGS
ncbi:AMIN-like domain-containing (lipo)protein [Rhabdothermincola salaria]|uniref:AMIN-like domain-containing (lipo)protein n=1 Tax=Rhabdothermincola salaria TaxID=2903142 RepID=UPI001E54F294|nr:hypothetical protein [Rhabdothermincola salaria]MCD9623917.1 hypothetical protein [Rhabdothermincola salaria]